jgi:uncharacterized protein
MNTIKVINRIEDFVKESCREFDSGHDWWHLNRVRNLALYLHNAENTGDWALIEISALLHDIDDNKFRKAGGKVADSVISELLNNLGVEVNIIHEVVRINKFISFSSGAKNENPSPEFLIVQDADRLDAIGAIGIARAFNYGGFRNNAIYIPENGEVENRPSTVGHFYDKLLKLKDLMNSATARRLAEKRHLFLEKFLSEFYSEWNINEERSF